VDDALVTALEEAIAELGTLLVQMDKFRAAETDDARRLRAASLAIGDRARRAHRHGALDTGLARDLRADADAARTALVRWLAGVRASPAYAAAVGALARGDATVHAAWPALFAGVVVEPAPAALFHPVVWQRRGRPRPATEIADELVGFRDEGLPGDGDPIAPGVDPALPAVLLHVEAPVGAPLSLAIRGAACPPAVIRLAATGDVLVPGVRVRLAFAVTLSAPDADEVDGWTLDPAALHRALTEALAARGLPVEDPSRGE
jgi:hypothetical protein